MLPQLDWAILRGMAVLVMNPNTHIDPLNGELIPHNETMQEHALYVWKTYVLNSGFKQVHIIAFQAGGKCLMEIQEAYEDTFYSQVGKISIVDS